MVMTLVWSAAIGLSVVLALVGLIALIHLWGRAKYGYPTKPDCVEFVHLSDGWSLGAERHYAKGERRGVVLTCHGMMGNRYNMDLGEGVSLVHYLKEQGYEVWNIDLRGTGHSRFHAIPHNPTPDWCFDDYVNSDIPAFLEAVTERAGVEKVHWIGHSMGGMIMYAYLGTHPEEKRLSSFAAISSPATWKRSFIFSAGTRLGQILVKFVPYLPLHYAFKTVAPFLFRAPVPGPLCYPPNLSTHFLRRSAFVIMESFSVSLAKQFSRMYQKNTFDSKDGSVDYRKHLSNITTPTCLITGVRDGVAPPESIEWVYEQISSPCKEIHIGGREHGASLDHCHASIVFSEQGARDTFPLLARWLDDRSTSS